MYLLYWMAILPALRNWSAWPGPAIAPKAAPLKSKCASEPQLGHSSVITTLTHYQKNANYRRSESVGNVHNPLVITFYRRTSDGNKSVSKPRVGNHLPTNCSSPPVITDRNIHRSDHRLLPTDYAVENYRRPYPSVNPFVKSTLLPTDISVDNYWGKHPSEITDDLIRR